MNKQIIKYLEQYKNQYSREALVEQLVKAGYKKEEIGQAAEFIYSGEASTGAKVETAQPAGSASERVRSILNKTGISEKPKKRKIIKTIFLAILLYFVFAVSSDIGGSLRSEGVGYVIGSGAVFIFSLPIYIVKLISCNNYYGNDGVFIFQIIYVFLWLYILSYSFNRTRNNKTLDAWMNIAKMNKKFFPWLIILFLIGVFLIINFTLTKRGYNNNGVMTTCFTFTDNLRDCYEFSRYNNGVQEVTQVSSRGNNYYTNCNTITGDIIKYRCQDGKAVEEAEKCPLGCDRSLWNGSRCLSENDRCVDSDGDDYYTKGSVVGRGNKYYDSCSGSYIYEYKCVNDFDYQSVSFRCPNGCDDGACIKSDLINDSSDTGIRCVDGDGKDYYKAGNVLYTAVDKQTNNNDYCLDENTVREYYCINNFQLAMEDYFCPNGCLNAACINILSNPINLESKPEGACADSDGGRDYYIKGSVKLTGELSKIEEEHYDACGSDGRLIETICLQGKPFNYSTIPFQCPNGCNNGACIK